MKVHLISYEDVDAWILGKIAKNLDEQLKLLCIESNIGKVPDYSADINHHICYWSYDGEKTKNDSIMITHIDTIQELEKVRKQMINARIGICMSLSTLNQLRDAGLPSQKLCYINPAHDGFIRPRKIVIGITSRIYDDGRKKENMLISISDRINPNEFSFKIMGSGWDKIVDEMRQKGFEIKYYPDFDYDLYNQIVPSFDYYLYFGFDEGSMGFLDALSAGVPTIVTPQGFHLDAVDGISYPIQNLDDIVASFEKIAEKKRTLVHSVARWTWENYAIKHAQVWEYILSNRSRHFQPTIKGEYPDGLNSLIREYSSHGSGDFIKKIFYSSPLSKFRRKSQ
jgi:glycosyltransferase involved in cell wall biosynthesis